MFGQACVKSLESNSCSGAVICDARLTKRLQHVKSSAGPRDVSLETGKREMPARADSHQLSSFHVDDVANAALLSLRESRILERTFTDCCLSRLAPSSADESVFSSVLVALSLA